MENVENKEIFLSQTGTLESTIAKMTSNTNTKARGQDKREKTDDNWPQVNKTPKEKTIFGQ
ncbi:MAG: hypothetical protein IPH36_19455 [Saprospiraceae bacterium]|nr:hypothetical protein [Saprospiraceae bacterium]